MCKGRKKRKSKIEIIVWWTEPEQRTRLSRKTPRWDGKTEGERHGGAGEEEGENEGNK